MLFIITYTVYIPIKIIVFLKYGVVGLAVAIGIHMTLNFLLQLVVLERTVGKSDSAGINYPTAAI
jgi:hypothetical protein